MSRMNRRARRAALKAHAVKTFQCQWCKGKIIRWLHDDTRISHETPICEQFRIFVNVLAKKHNVLTTEGQPYLAALMLTGDDTGKAEVPS